VWEYQIENVKKNSEKIDKRRKASRQRKKESSLEEI